jgi:hypothetical protein
MGTPARPDEVEFEPMPVGEDADAAGLPAGPAALPAQVPEAIPVTPLASKSEPGELPGTLDPPLIFPAGEVMPEHVVLLLVDGPSSEVPDVAGLSPMGPSGVPVPGTAGAGPMPSGDVVVSGDGALAPIWADAEPHRKSAAIAPINTRAMTTPLG